MIIKFILCSVITYIIVCRWQIDCMVKFFPLLYYGVQTKSKQLALCCVSSNKLYYASLAVQIRLVCLVEESHDAVLLTFLLWYCFITFLNWLNLIVIHKVEKMQHCSQLCSRNYVLSTINWLLKKNSTVTCSFPLVFNLEAS